MQFNKHTLQRILFFSGAVSLLIVYLLSWVDVIRDPQQRTASDFMAFYAAGRSMLEHGSAAAYDLTYLKTNEEKVLGFQIADRDINPFVHPPFILPILWSIAHFEYVPAFYLWIVVMLLLCVLCAHMTLKLIAESNDLNRVILWTGVFLFFPLYIGLVNGQDSALLLLGCMIWYYGLTQNSSRTAGLGLALTTIRPQIALVLAIPFLFNRSHRKVWWWFCLGALILAVASILFVGWDGVRNFLNILSVSASGEGYKINEIAMVNLIGLTKRLMPNLDATVIRTIGWVVALFGLISLCVLWWKSPSIQDTFISLAVILAAFTSAHLHYHDLAILIIPILVLIRKLTTAQMDFSKFTLLIPFGVSLLFLFTYSIPQLTYLVIYLVELALLISSWLINRRYETNPSTVYKKIGEP